MTTMGVPAHVILTVHVLVRLIVPDPDLGVVTLRIWRNHGFADVAVQAIGLSSKLPTGLRLHVLGPLRPNDTLVSRSCVCVVST
jgi:hypothetical protein